MKRAKIVCHAYVKRTPKRVFYASERVHSVEVLVDGIAVHATETKGQHNGISMALQFCADQQIEVEGYYRKRFSWGINDGQRVETVKLIPFEPEP